MPWTVIDRRGVQGYIALCVRHNAETMPDQRREIKAEARGYTKALDDLGKHGTVLSAYVEADLHFTGEPPPMCCGMLIFDEDVIPLEAT